MTKKERITRALLGQSVDHVPSGFWFHFPDAQFFGTPAVEAHLEFYRQTDVDLLKVMNEYQLLFETRLVSPSDWRKLKPLSIRNSLHQGQLDTIKRVVDAIGDEVPIIATIHGVFASAFHTSRRDDEQFSNSILLDAHLRESPEDVAEGLAVVAESLTELGMACLEAGASGIYYAALGGEEHRYSQQEFEDWIKPHDLTVLSALHEAADILCLHICKDKVRLPQYRDYPAHVVNWAVHDSDYSLEDGRSIFGRTILGGLDDRSGVMVEGSPDEVRREVQDIIGRFGREGFILGCDCTLPTEARLENIRAAIGAARGD